MDLTRLRQAIRPLLEENSPADATAAYYAFHHPADRTRIVTFPEGEPRAAGYVCLSRTGMDLFRPLVTMRLPEGAGGPDPEASSTLLHRALRPNSPVIIHAPAVYRPLLGALFALQQEQSLRILVLDRGRFEPIINVLVAEAESYNGLPRFVIRQTGGVQPGERGDVMAASGLNWESDHFADVYVNTRASVRRQGLGQSVLAYAVKYVLDRDRIPLYAAADENEPSLRLAESVGFVDLGLRASLLEGTLLARPA